MAFRLILLLAFFNCVVGVRWLNEYELPTFLEKHNTTLIGYVGSSDCLYSDNFIEQVEDAADYLKEERVNVALTKKTYEYERNVNPLLVFRRPGYDPRPLTSVQDGRDIALYVQRTLHPNVSSVLNVTDEKTYNFFLDRYQTVFFASLTESSQIEEYKKVASKVDNIFILLEGNSSNFPNMKYSTPGYYVQYNQITKQQPVKFDGYGDFEKWCREQMNGMPQPLTDSNAIQVFNIDVKNFAVFFAPQSWQNYTETLKNFEKVAAPYKSRLAIFYVNVESGESSEMMDFFGVSKYDVKIVRFTTNFKELDAFKKSCSNSPTGFNESRKLFLNNDNNDIIKFFKNSLNDL